MVISLSWMILTGTTQQETNTSKAFYMAVIRVVILLNQTRKFVVATGMSKPLTLRTVGVTGIRAGQMSRGDMTAVIPRAISASFSIEFWPRVRRRVTVSLTTTSQRVKSGNTGLRVVR